MMLEVLALAGIFIKLAIGAGIIVFAFKLYNRVAEIAEAQKSLVESQRQLVKHFTESSNSSVS